jgi:D-threo-aldose 1-dehydrogenase
MQPRIKKRGVSIPPIVFGATTLGNLFRAVSDEEKAEVVKAWLNCGLKPILVDSAGKYGAGMSLEVIGRELARCDVQPEDVLISNKLAWRRVPLTSAEPTFEPGAWFGISHDAVQDISREGILRCWREGNQLLGNYSAQLVSVHDPDEYLDAAKSPQERNKRLNDIISAYTALCDLRDQGEVAAVGVGAKSWRVIQELDQHCDFDWVMLANSFTVMSHPLELIEFMNSLAERSISIINSALFHGGFLLGGDFFDYRRLSSNSESDAALYRWRTRFFTACEQLNVSPFQVGVAFGKSHPAVTAVALSSSRAARVEEHVATVQQSLAPEIWTELKSRGLVAADYPFI